MIWEADVYCPNCKSIYGKIYRQQVSDTVWEHRSVPANIPKYCGICERPTERKPLV